MKRKHLIALCGLALLSIISTACSVKSNSSTASKQSSKTVKVTKSKPKKKKIDKKSKAKDVDKKKQKDDQKVKANSQSKKTANAQASQQQNNQQASKNNQQQVSSQAQSQNQGNATQQGQQPQQKTQGQINRERGYDPNGAPLLPGQDHAAGSNPDGSPDSWVQGQIDWAKRNGLMNSDGSPTQKEKDIEASQDQYAEGDDGGQFGGYVPNP